jgi:branched-chain amino acid transport system permease protein
MKDRQILVRDLLLLLAFAGWGLALPHYGSEFVVSMALTCLMYVALSSSWGLFCGSTRYLSLATSAFFGIGAYTSAIALEHLSWLESIALGAGLAAVVAVVMGAAVLHLRGTYFAVLTFGMTELIRHAVTYFEKSVTGPWAVCSRWYRTGIRFTSRCWRSLCWRWRCPSSCGAAVLVLLLWA